MVIEKLEDCPVKNPGIPVKVTEMGNVTQVQYMSHRNHKQTIQMLPGCDSYLELSTGEIKDVVRHDNRSEQKKSLYRTFQTARGVINSNVTDVTKVRWITLTYAENMTDPKILYSDFEKFNKRFQTYCKKNNYGKPEYIVMMEPQARGAWHAHLLYLFPGISPFVPNSDLAKIWGHGFVKIKKLDNVDNVGAYLTAYLGDMEITECGLSQLEGKELKVVENTDDFGKKEKKYYVKGARLDLYPAKFNMIRCSRGVLRPIEEMMSQEMAENKVSGATKTYEKTVRLIDNEHDFDCFINTVQYNKIRKKTQ